MRLAAITTTVLGLTLGAVAESAKASSSSHRWWNMVYNCESKGSSDPWYTNTGNGYYFGPQFARDTWHGFGGGPVREMGDQGGRPMHTYSVSYIVNIAEKVLRGQGFGAWPNCNGYL